MKRSQSGSALIYVLVAIALLAILTATLSENSGSQSQSQRQTKLISELSSQIDFIRSAIQECVINYPNQDSELTATQQKNKPYPIQPNDPYFTSQSATPGAASDTSVRSLRCPGNPGGTGPTNQNHAPIFGSSSGKFFPPPPSPMENWYWYNGTDGVFMLIGTPKTDSYLGSALKKLEAKYSPCEADLLDATSGTITYSSEGYACGTGMKCFRYWLVRKPSAIPAKAGCN